MWNVVTWGATSRVKPYNSGVDDTNPGATSREFYSCFAVLPARLPRVGAFSSNVVEELGKLYRHLPDFKSIIKMFKALSKLPFEM